MVGQIHTVKDEHSVKDRVDDGLHGRYTSDPSMEVVKGRKVPSRKPEDEVIPHPEKPD
jgi:hypothetical protein